ncbi:MAG: TonB-dependent receptor [Bacteroidetes bacterium]|nr:TonB-dependent receptor [Bacteroidota bacterium]
MSPPDWTFLLCCMKKARFILLTLLVLLIQLPVLNAQGLKQTVRGVVKDAVSKQALSGATILVKNDAHQYGSITDENGAYSIPDVEIGRYDIVCQYVGYEERALFQVEVTATKEVVLNFDMTEDLATLGVAEIKLRKDKSKTINSDIRVSGRTFSIEESQRYAGSRGDVARMAQNFAGVQGANDSRNDIIVRGNSPMGVLYRLEGIDIPNPNHFSSSGTTGGPVSMLNNNVLLNSDFISGAFPAEYGNANAAVFDLGVREGNNEKYEFLGQIGFAGFEGMAEGPFKKGKQASFLIDYRYSFLGLLATMGVNFGTGAAIPKYQDLTVKLNFPDKHGYTSLFALGGMSRIKIFQSEQTGDNLYRDGQEDLTYRTKTGVVGLTRYQQIGTKSNIKFILAVDGSYTRTQLDTFAWSTNNEIINYSGRYRDGSSQGKYSLNVIYTHKFNAKASMSAGTRLYEYFFNLEDSFFRSDLNRWVQPTNFNGNTTLSQTFTSLSYRFGPRLKMNTGINYAYFFYNNSQSLEPRIGLSYKVNGRYQISAGSGLHSQVVPFRVYYEKFTDDYGHQYTANQDVTLMRSLHFVLSHDVSINRNSRLKIETYYQHLFNIPVDRGDWPSYSMLNQGTDFGVQFTDSLVNKGTGRNYGIEFTLERFLSKGFYFLNTISLYRSLYTDYTGAEHSTAFDGKYAMNLLGGKEFYFKQRETKSGFKKPSLTVDIKAMINGGKRYTPIDVSKSVEQVKTVYTDDIYGAKYKDYTRLDIRIAYKVQTKKITQEWGIDIQNVTNHQNIFTQRFDPATGKTYYSYQTGILPIGIYRATF